MYFHNNLSFRTLCLLYFYNFDLMFGMFSDEELQAKTPYFKQLLESGKTLKDIKYLAPKAPKRYVVNDKGFKIVNPEFKEYTKIYKSIK